MSPELTQWIPPAVIVALMLYLHRVTRPGRSTTTRRRAPRRETVGLQDGPNGDSSARGHGAPGRARRSS